MPLKEYKPGTAFNGVIGHTFDVDPERFPRGYLCQLGRSGPEGVDCYNAGATILHVHCRNPKTGKIAKVLDDYSYLMERLRKAVPKMILQLGGSISFAPAKEGEKAKWLGYDTRHMLTEVTPKPDQVTVAIGSSLYDLTSLMTPDDVKGTQLEDPKAAWLWAQQVADSTPEFYIEHLKRLREHGIHPGARGGDERWISSRLRDWTKFLRERAQSSP